MTNKMTEQQRMNKFVEEIPIRRRQWQEASFYKFHTVVRCTSQHTGFGDPGVKSRNRNAGSKEMMLMLRASSQSYTEFKIWEMWEEKQSCMTKIDKDRNTTVVKVTKIR